LSNPEQLEVIHFVEGIAHVVPVVHCSTEFGYNKREVGVTFSWGGFSGLDEGPTNFSCKGLNSALLLFLNFYLFILY
jgi:hypothetical protein